MMKGGDDSLSDDIFRCCWHCPVFNYWAFQEGSTEAAQSLSQRRKKGECKEVELANL
jgi:hypothetical protein